MNGTVVNTCSFYRSEGNIHVGMNTDRLLHVCEHSCEHEALRSEVDDTEEQRVKDQQRGLVSIEQHVAEGVTLVCRRSSNIRVTDKRKHM